MGNQSMPNQSSKDSTLIQLIIFRAGEEEFGIPIEMVREIIKRNIITAIPNSPRFIKGIINVRGEIVTTIDMKLRFSLQSTKNIEEKHVIVTKHDDSLFGLLVDEVIEVLRTPKKEIKTPPNLLTKINHDYISGVISHDNRLIILLDLNKILSHQELIQLAANNKKLGKKEKVTKEMEYEKNINH